MPSCRCHRFYRNVRVRGRYGGTGSATARARLDWTGWYAGVNVGASFGNANTDFSGPVSVPGIQLTPDFAFSNREYPDGFIGGGQIGYNWQYSPLIVVGLEADIQGAVERDTNNFGPTNFAFLNLPMVSSLGTVATSYTTQIDWFGTVRASGGMGG